MAIKNYTTIVPANRSIAEIQDALVRHGAVGIAMGYEHGTGRISTLHFQLMINEKPVSFALPVQWRRFQEVLKKQRARGKGKGARWDNEDYCYRVAWRCLCDWVLAQLALYETQIVELPQIFLPFAVGRDGQTLYDHVMSGQLLIGSGDE